jgi:5'-methylthioadenosine phosphorylase
MRRPSARTTDRPRSHGAAEHAAVGHQPGRDARHDLQDARTAGRGPATPGDPIARVVALHWSPISRLCLAMADRTLGVIGGSGLYELPGLEGVEQIAVRTPFGEPSDALVCGRLGGTTLVFLPRHGRGHRLLPSELPFRANLWAMKSLGVDAVLAVSAVGSLREEIVPGHVVVPDQFIDRTRARTDDSTFFGRGVVAHVQFADPFCPVLSQALVGAVRAAGATVHAGGTYVCMEGPAFSTRAESVLYRSWGGHVIGMTNLQEAKLAREAEICFATMALATDYDCWHPHHADVQIDEILKVIAANVELARRTVAQLAPALPPRTGCPCPTALASAIITDRTAIPADVKRDLAPIAGRYL